MSVPLSSATTPGPFPGGYGYRRQPGGQDTGKQCSGRGDGHVRRRYRSRAGVSGRRAGGEHVGKRFELGEDDELRVLVNHDRDLM
ncbi:MAG: hypothetical protein WBF57_00975, partial [Mycobacterium sp.]